MVQRLTAKQILRHSGLFPQCPVRSAIRKFGGSCIWQIDPPSSPTIDLSWALNPTRAPVLWIGTAGRISAVVEMNHPGVWIMGDTADDDRNHGMGIVVEYANRTGKAQWLAPPRSKWQYGSFGSKNPAQEPNETFEMTFTKANAADQGFNRWEINGVAYPNTMKPASPASHLKQRNRYRIRMRNASDDIHPIHLHRHVFELTNVAGQRTSGVIKAVVMVGG